MLCAALLNSCGPAERKETGTIEEQPEEQLEEQMEKETGYETWLQRYTVRSSSITLTDRKEADFSMSGRR